MKINYHGRKFAGVSNSPNGEVTAETIFLYEQHGQKLTAIYNGGNIREGHMIGRVNEDNSLDFVYHHIDLNGHLKSGHCISIPELLPEGRIRLHERWQWTYGAEGSGESVVMEI